MSAETPSNVVQMASLKTLTFVEAMEVLHLKKSSLHALVKSGAIRCIKYNRKTFFRPEHLREWQDRHESGGETASANLRGLT